MKKEGRRKGLSCVQGFIVGLSQVACNLKEQMNEISFFLTPMCVNKVISSFACVSATFSERRRPSRPFPRPPRHM